MGCVTGPSPTSWAPPGTPRCATFFLNAMGTGLLAMALWEPYILRRVDQLDTMVFGHFKYAARHFMTSK